MTEKKATNKEVFIIIIVSLIVVLPVMFYLNSILPSGSATSDDIDEPIATIRAEDLIDDFYNNEVRAKSDYITKWLEVDGKISTIDGDSKEAKLIFYNDKLFDFLSVTCYIDTRDEINKVLELNTGDRVTVTGKLVRRFLNNLELRQCKITNGK